MILNNYQHLFFVLVSHYNMTLENSCTMIEDIRLNILKFFEIYVYIRRQQNFNYLLLSRRELTAKSQLQEMMYCNCTKIKSVLSETVLLQEQFYDDYKQSKKADNFKKKNDVIIIFRKQ